jgi:predicted DNA-binding protein
MGRRKKSIADRCSEVVNFKVTLDERHQLQRLAEDVGTTVSSYLRAILKDHLENRSSTEIVDTIVLRRLANGWGVIKGGAKP